MFNRNRYCKLYIVIVVCLFIPGYYLFGQDNKEKNEETVDTLSSAYIRKQNNLNINKALKTSLIPALSQIKNKQYLKATFYYAGLSSLTISAIKNHNNYKNSKTDYFNEFSSVLPYSFYATLSENSEAIDLYPNEVYKYRFLRNISITGLGLLYCINLADAIKPVKRDYHSAYKAGLYSALVPGLGQIYNGNYWKVPLVYIGLGAFAFYINYNHTEYKKFLKAYLILQDTEAWEYGMNYLDENSYKYDNRTIWDDANFTRGDIYKIELYNKTIYPERADRVLYLKNTWKRYRDLTIIGISAFYLLNIIDATVFAHLHDYDVSEELSIDFSPKLFNASRHELGCGFQLTMNF